MEANPLRLCVEAPNLLAQAQAQLDAGDVDQALRSVALAVSSIYPREDMVGHSLYLFGFDRLLQRIGLQLADEPWPRPPVDGANLIILSEFYRFGGHSRVAEDLVETLGGAVVVITDLFDTYDTGRNRLEEVAARMPRAWVVRLREKGLLQKVLELRTLLRAVRPSRLFVLAHHPDPVPYVAAANLPPGVQKVFVHHCDHQPALGNTLPGYLHVDLSQHLQRICAGNLARPCAYLPLFVPDRGARRFAAPELATMSVVTCGSAVKYRLQGTLAYPEVVVDVLTTVGGRYWHIGGLDAPWLAAIAQALARAGIAADRFCHVPHVPSLWAALQEIDAQVFLGSFPVGGGRAAIEAQGCGFPVLFFTSDERPPLLQNEDVFADRALGWGTREQLRAGLQLVARQHAGFVAGARRHYDRHYSRAAFVGALHAVTGAQAPDPARA